MAKFIFLQPEELQQIATKLATWMPPMVSWNSCMIAESLELYTVDMSDLNSAKSARDCLRSTGIWHIQIRIDQTAAYFARVARVGNSNEWKVNAVYGPGLPIKIDTALTWIDQYIHDDFVVSIFELADYFITGLTLEKGDDIRVYIVSTVPGLKVETGKLYRFDEMRGLLVHQAPVHGVQ